MAALDMAVDVVSRGYLSISLSNGKGDNRWYAVGVYCSVVVSLCRS